MLRSRGWLILAASLLPGVAGAQNPARSAEAPCFRARPAPQCKVFFLTNAGGYARPGHGRNLRAILDWGVLVNVDRRTAVGGSWFVTLDEDNFGTGPVARVRHWFPANGSVDIGVGTPLASGNGVRPGSLYTLIEYNPVHWFGVAVRPEYVRRDTYVCSVEGCLSRMTASGRIYGGVEFGGVPGVVLSLGSAIALGTLVAIVVASGGFD